MSLSRRYSIITQKQNFVVKENSLATNLKMKHYVHNFLFYLIDSRNQSTSKLFIYRDKKNMNSVFHLHS